MCHTESTTLNPASLLPNPDLDAPLHNCIDILSQVYSLRQDLTDQPLPDAELTWCTDKSSYLLEEILLKYSMPAWLSSDNGPAFTSQVIKRLFRVLEAD